MTERDPLSAPDSSPDAWYDSGDARRAARAALPGDVWDFLTGGSGTERTLADNRTALDGVPLVPRIMTDVTRCDTATELAGTSTDLPLGIAPIAYHRLFHPEGEPASARAAEAAGAVFVAGMLSSRPLEDITAVCSRTWLQLYWLRDRGLLKDLVARAEAAGCRALVLTVDVPRMGRRLRDIRNEFALPADVVAANFPAATTSTARTRARGASAVMAHTGETFDPSLSWPDVAWLRDLTTLPIVLKGVLHPEDARRATETGVAAVVVSNHGGRQLDGAPPSVSMLPAVREAVEGRVQILLDSGIRSGTDVLRALSLGADGVLVGRPAMWGLAAGGQGGAERVLRLLRTELEDAMALAGCPCVSDAQRIGSDSWNTRIRGRAHRWGGGRSGARGKPGKAEEGGDAERRRPTTTPPGAAHRHATPTHPMRATSKPAAEQWKERSAMAVTRDLTATSLFAADLHASLASPTLASMNFLNEVAIRFPDAISFAAGRPYEGHFDVSSLHEYLDAFCGYLSGKLGHSDEEITRLLFQYGRTKGIVHELIAKNLLVDENIRADPESVVVTVGCQEAMFLVLRALRRNAQDVLLAVSPTYVGITGAAELVDMPVVPVAGEAGGLDLDDLVESVARARSAGLNPRALYIVPDFSNPAGESLDLPSRHRLLEIAGELDILLLEDNPYGLFGDDGDRLPTLKSLDRGRRVVYLGSFAKTGLPGARVGYAVADQPVVDAAGGTGLLADELSKLKSMLTLNTSPVAQAVIGGKLVQHDFSLVRANAREAELYRGNRRRLLAGLARRFPLHRDPGATVTWNTPAGGFFLVVTVPFEASDARLEESAERYGVLWTPMHHFYTGTAGGTHQLRLSCSLLTPGLIEEGLDRLAAFVDDHL
ncbi:aminotransferase class I/II-fold pyridoxal phosphate-dependent enzyme [Streptomyces sp. NPDC002476]|uniref:aminotransferase class I/II-fold pyridoxal phosphate-dependent enzyme n=1 Tax=Streptomyces sp. NPDC002476 TaxID=3364648 RepID=UPI0036CA4192